jgi:hypothetical protein
VAVSRPPRIERDNRYDQQAQYHLHEGRSVYADVRRVGASPDDLFSFGAATELRAAIEPRRK